MKGPAPIILLVYNRPWHTLQTLEALSKNTLADQSILYIFADGAKANAVDEDVKMIAETRTIIRSRKWCSEVNIIERDHNLGLADSIVSGVTEIVNRYGKIIVLEDDIVTSKGFLQYMNEALQIYEKENKVMHIAGYVPIAFEGLPSTFFYNQASCWGWATWSRAWKSYSPDAGSILDQIKRSFRYSEFDLDGSYPFTRDLDYNVSGKMKTWAVKWHGSVFLKDGLCLHPNLSLVQNIGTDGSGTHCDESNAYTVKTLANEITVEKIDALEENLSARKQMVSFYYGIGISSKPFDPITGSQDIMLLKSIPSQRIINKYKQELNIDVSDVFTSIPKVRLFRCNESQYVFFYPFNLSGDGAFYEKLQAYDWYYRPWKWEHENASSFVKKGMTVLEVGCAQGEFLERISKENDVKAVGLELNKRAISIGRERRLDIRNETIQSHSKNYAEQYDLVCSFQVLEHISDVKSFLDAQLTCLKQGGALIISVPDNDGFLDDSDNVLNLPPHHMGLWNKHSLIQLQKYFNIEHIMTYYEPRQQYHLSYFRKFLRKKFRPFKPFINRVIKNETLRNFFFTKEYQPFTIQVVFKK
jgi:2-polyprenyl-3-methyl-5-hydroxy-6-metoxy-1,4-benzoquinol methylase